MRKREILRDKRKAAKLDCPLDRELIERYIEACQCPFCKDGIAYKMLSLHIYQAHGISAYEFRRKFGMNRHHKLISCETSERMSQRNQLKGEALQRFLQHPNWGNLQNRYKDGGKRPEAIEKQKVLQNKPESKERFQRAMAKVDRKAIALRIPPELRKERARTAVRGWKEKWNSMTDTERREFIHKLRALITPESCKIRAQHAAETFKERYWSDPIWYEKWLKRITEAKQAKAKVPRIDYPAIVSLYESGMSQKEIACFYGVSGSLIHLIIKSQKLGLPKLYNPSYEYKRNTKR